MMAVRISILSRLSKAGGSLPLSVLIPSNEMSIVYSAAVNELMREQIVVLRRDRDILIRAWVEGLRASTLQPSRRPGVTFEGMVCQAMSLLDRDPMPEDLEAERDQPRLGCGPASRARICGRCRRTRRMGWCAGR